MTEEIKAASDEEIKEWEDGTSCECGGWAMSRPHTPFCPVTVNPRILARISADRALLDEVSRVLKILRDDAIQYMNFSTGAKGNKSDLADAVAQAKALLTKLEKR